jgi:secreted protein with Ig-like and vWFA domain
MNDDTDKPLNTVGDDALEARITAWVLGEASSFEAGELEKLCAADPALRLFERRLRVLHGLVAEDFQAGPAAAWKLAAGRREKITDLLGVEPVVEEVLPRRKKSSGPSVRGLILALAACVVIGFVSVSLLGGIGQSAKESKVMASYAARSEGLVRESMPMAENMSLERSGPSSGAPVKKPVSSYAHLTQNSAFTAKPPPAMEAHEAPDTSAYRQARAGASLADMDGVDRSNPGAGAGGPPAPPATVAPAAKPASGPAPDEQALALNETRSAIRAKDSAVDQPGFLGGGAVGGAGGTRGEPAQPLATRTNRDFIPTVEGVTIPGVPPAPGSEVTDILTAGNRSGDGAITRNSIDAVLNHPARATAKEGEDSGVAALTGTFSDEAVDTILKSVEEKSEVNARGLDADSAGAPDLAFQDRKMIGVRGGDAEPPGAAGGVPLEPAAEDRFAMQMDLDRDGATPATEFGDLETMGRLAGEGKAESGARLGGVNYYNDHMSGVTNGVADLSDFAKKQNEAEPAGAVAGRWFSMDESTKELKDAKAPGGAPAETLFDTALLPGQAVGGLKRDLSLDPNFVQTPATRAPAATGDFEGFVNQGAPIQSEIADESTRARFQFLTEAEPPSLPLAKDATDATAGELTDLDKEASAGIEPSGDEVRARILEEVDKAWDLSVPPVDAPLAKAAESEAKPGEAGVDLPIPVTPALKVTDPAAVEDVRRKLYIAEGGYNLGKFEDAQKTYEEVLRIDPYNQAARRGMEQVAAARADDYRAAYDQTRAELLAEVDGAWELPVPPVAGEAASNPAAAGDPILANPALGVDGGAAVDEVRRKLYAAEGNYNLGKYDESHRAYEDVLRVDPTNEAARRGMEKVAAARNDYYRAAYDQVRVGEPPVATDGNANVSAASEKVSELTALLDFDGTAPATDGRYSSLAGKEMIRRQGAVTQSDSLRDEGRAAYAAGNYAEAYRKLVESLHVLPDAPMVKDRRDYIQQVLQDASEALAITAERVGERELAAKWKEKSLEWTPKKAAAVEPTAETLAADEPFSTFSLHVSDASFKLAHAAMERGEVPAAEGIRPEEFYNAFDYGDPAPAAGEPVVCVTEQSAHPAFPQRNLLRIGVRTGSQGRGASTPLNLTLLLDHSGSMEREDRNAGLAMAVRQLSSLLKEGDTITVAGFSRQPRLLADRLPGARAQELNELIARTPSEGGTNLEEGLKLAGELAKRQFNPAAQNRVVLFTDGAANLGDARPEALQARIEALRQQGIAFDAAGFGADGLNDKLLERLTRNGNGRYYVVDGPEDADAGFAKQLAGAFRPAAENVKVQVRFNPARVAKYKLIGFEEHRLQKEDFRNDAVDAAEMAAEEAGNALYQIETLPQGEGEVGEVSVRFRDVASGQMVERTWTIPYDAQAPAFDQATPSIQLAGLAAFTAEKLRGAPMADAVDFQQLGQVYAGVRARYPNSQPVADLGSMIGKMK